MVHAENIMNLCNCGWPAHLVSPTSPRAYRNLAEFRKWDSCTCACACTQYSTRDDVGADLATHVVYDDMYDCTSKYTIVEISCISAGSAKSRLQEHQSCVRKYGFPQTGMTLADQYCRSQHWARFHHTIHSELFHP